MRKNKILAGILSLLLAAPATGFTANAAVAGDANNDGKLTVADLVLIQNYLLGKSSRTPSMSCDLVKDNVIDTYDFIEMRRAILKTPKYMPYTAINLSRDVAAENVSGLSASDEFIAGQTDFSLSLFQRQVKDNKNVLISPYSVMQALAMAANGADENTLAEMENVLGGIPIETLNKYLYTQRGTQPNQEKCSLNTANSIWAKNGKITIEPDFLQNNANYYDAQIFNADFDESTVNDINKWVDASTDHMIPTLLKEISPDTVMYLINAVSFNAEWADPYKKTDVYERDFTCYDGEIKQCDMMLSIEHTYIEDENAVGFVKYYNGGRYYFAGILPNEDMSVTDYISGLTPDGLHNMLSDKKDGYVRSGVPKFSFEYESSLKNDLQAMGMNDAFEVYGNFSKMGKTETGYLFINNVLHKTFIEVSEKGTKAAAVTSVEMANGACAPTKEVEVILNRPFVFMIVDSKTNLPVFIGSVADI